MDNITKWSVSIYIIASVMMLPFISCIFILFLSFLFSFATEIKRHHIFFVCLICSLVFIPYVALKSSIDVVGNDKAQYYSYMEIMINNGISDFISHQPEILSFAILHLFANVFGVNDTSYYLIGFLFFSLLLHSVWKFNYRALPIFIILFCGTYIFYATFGNLIRQAMALPFIAFAVLCEKKYNSIFLSGIAILFHLPSAIILIPCLFLIGGFSFKFSVSAFICISVIIFSLFSLDGFLYLDKKLDLYSNWEFVDVTGLVIVAIFWLVIIHLIFILSKSDELWNSKKGSILCRLKEMITIVFFILLAFYTFGKVFERIYIYYFLLVVLYISFSLSSLSVNSVRYPLAIVFGMYGLFGIILNFTKEGLFFMGKSHEYVYSGLINIYAEILR